MEKKYAGEVSPIMEILLDTGGITYIGEAGDECWIWGKSSGILRIAGRNHLVHRLVWLDVYGEIPDDDLVVRVCDRRLCCNPNHLTLLSRYENAKRMIAKRKTRYGVGSKLPSVDSVRADYIGGMTQQALAAKYGVSQSAISKAIRDPNRH